MVTRRHHLLVAAALAAALVTSSGSASARSQRNLAWRSDQAWTAALRLLRVDLGFDLVERDSDARFVLFNYQEGEREFPGSLEVVERRLEDGRDGVRIIVNVPALPAYVELNLIDRLERKLREEVGPPLPPTLRRDRARRGFFERRGRDRDGDREEEPERADDDDEEGDAESSDD